MLTLAGNRTTTSAVTFTQSFRLGKDDRVHPPGMYTLHTLEEVYEGDFEPVYLATSVDFEVRDGAQVTTRIVSPAALTEALERDKNQVIATSTRSIKLADPLSGNGPSHTRILAHRIHRCSDLWACGLAHLSRPRTLNATSPCS